jgi:hypothetical protein
VVWDRSSERCCADSCRSLRELAAADMLAVGCVLAGHHDDSACGTSRCVRRRGNARCGAVEAVAAHADEGVAVSSRTRRVVIWCHAVLRCCYAPHLFAALTKTITPVTAFQGWDDWHPVCLMYGILTCNKRTRLHRTPHNTPFATSGCHLIQLRRASGCAVDAAVCRPTEGNHSTGIISTPTDAAPPHKHQQHGLARGQGRAGHRLHKRHWAGDGQGARSSGGKRVPARLWGSGGACGAHERVVRSLLLPTRARSAWRALRRRHRTRTATRVHWLRWPVLIAPRRPPSSRCGTSCRTSTRLRRPTATRTSRSRPSFETWSSRCVCRGRVWLSVCLSACFDAARWLDGGAVEMLCSNVCVLCQQPTCASASLPSSRQRTEVVSSGARQCGWRLGRVSVDCTHAAGSWRVWAAGYPREQRRYGLCACAGNIQPVHRLHASAPHMHAPSVLPSAPPLARGGAPPAPPHAPPPPHTRARMQASSL